MNKSLLREVKDASSKPTQDQSFARTGRVRSFTCDPYTFLRFQQEVTDTAADEGAEKVVEFRTGRGSSRLVFSSDSDDDDEVKREPGNEAKRSRTDFAEVLSIILYFILLFYCLFCYFIIYILLFLLFYFILPLDKMSRPAFLFLKPRHN